MDESTKQFGRIAGVLSHNPLGIIALFIVLVYGFAALVTAFGTGLTEQERIPLIYFLVVFPILVLAVFAWLVSSHSGKLFAPSDFRDESNYIRMQNPRVVASLAAAASKDSDLEVPDITRILKLAESEDTKAIAANEGWKICVLWVDDRPENNVYERQAFEAIGLSFSLALSTSEALKVLSREKFAAIISDMGRREGPREGYVLLDTLRERGDQTPLFFYAASNSPQHKQETSDHGAQGCTNNAQELFEMVTRSIVQSKTAQ